MLEEIIAERDELQRQLDEVRKLIKDYFGYTSTIAEWDRAEVELRRIAGGENG